MMRTPIRTLILFGSLLGLAACGGGEDEAASANGGSAAGAEASAPASGSESGGGEQAGGEAQSGAEDASGQESDEAAEAGGSEGAQLSDAAITEADTIFRTRCATCHGAEGKGDAPAAKNFPVQPRDYTDQEWQKSVTDEYLAKVIVEGGASVGLNALMTPNADLKDKPEVVDALVAKIRGFAGE